MQGEHAAVMARPPRPTVVVSYGAADVPESWELVVRELDAAFRIVVPRRIAEVDPVEQLTAAIDAQPTPPIVVGHSFGGLLTGLATSGSTRGVAGLVLVDATSARAAASAAACASLRAAALGLRIASPLARTRVAHALLGHDLVPLVPRQRSLRRALGDDRYAAWRDAIARGIADGTAAAELAAVIPTALRAAGLVPPVAPIAVVHSRSLTRRLERPAPGATRRAAHVTDTGDRFHNIHLVHPDAVADAVRVIAAEAAARRADPPPASQSPSPALLGCVGARG